MFHDRKYVIVPHSEVHKIDFREVMETSYYTLRFSVDGTKTFVKYEGEMPDSVQTVDHRSEEYTHEQILEILSTPDWTPAEEPQEPS